MRETRQGVPAPWKSGKSLKGFCLLAHKAGFRLVCKQGGTVECIVRLTPDKNRGEAFFVLPQGAD